MKKINLVIFLILSIYVLYLTVFKIEPSLKGDGVEYLLMTQAIANHLTPDIRPDDVEKSLVILRDDQRTKHKRTMTDIKNFVGNEKYQPMDGSWGIVRSYTSKNYSYHFWFYSAVCVPVTWITRIFNGNEFRAFFITNALIMILVFFYILFYSMLGNSQKLLAMLLYFGCGTTYYLDWPHPEIYSSACIFLALLMMLDKKYYGSVLMAVLGSFQNPPIAFLIPFVLFKYYYDNGFKIKPLVGLALLGSLSLYPSLFYLYHFKVPNLIIHIAGVSREYLTLSRFGSLFFDINQGIIVAMPVLLFTYIYLLIKHLIYKHERNFYLSLALLIIFMAIPSIQQKNWNMGQSVFIRYGLWISMPMIFYVVTRVEWGKVRNMLLAVVILLSQAFILITNKVYNNEDWKYLVHNRAAFFMMSKFPRLYNPEPEIFGERILHKEEIRPSDSPIIYINHKNEMKKIMVHEEYIDSIPYKLDVDKKYWAEKKENLRFRYGWAYVNNIKLNSDE